MRFNEFPFKKPDGEEGADKGSCISPGIQSCSNFCLHLKYTRYYPIKQIGKQANGNKYCKKILPPRIDQPHYKWKYKKPVKRKRIRDIPEAFFQISAGLFSWL